jgi:DNA polymerase I-like protein with 3'-5' exonuclease and polymerase domains/uracil-DNA glycosylase
MIQHVSRGDGPIPSRIFLVGEAWGSEEERTHLPFQGASGQLLNQLLHEAGIMRSECYASNVVNARPPRNDIEAWVTKKRKDITPTMIRLRDFWAEPIVLAGWHKLLAELHEVQPNIVVALGNTAMWALTGLTGISKWRGSQLTASIPRELYPPGLLGPADSSWSGKVIPVLHPSAILRDPSQRQLAVLDLKRAAKERSPNVYTNVPEWRFTVRPTFEQATETLRKLTDDVETGLLEWLDFDIETAAGHIECVGISWSLSEAIIIPLMCRERRTGYWSEEEEGEIVYALYRLLTHPRAKVRWQNGLYDAQYTYRWWHFVPRGAQDTMISHHSAFCGLPKSLAFQASMYCDHYVYWKDDGKVADLAVPEDERWRYNGTDCVRTREVGEASARTIASLGLGAVDDFQQKFFWPVLQCMQRGIAVDKKVRAKFAEELMEEMSKREAFFAEVLGHPLDPHKKLQMAKLFYEDLGQPPIHLKAKRGIPGGVTCGKEALVEIAKREPILRGLVKAIAEHRSLGVFLSTFVNAPLDIDGRMRTSYNICGTETFRFSSSKNAFGSGTNLQNVPKGDESSEDDDEEVSLLGRLRLPNVRKIFVPDPGFEIFDKDLSKADLRIVTWEADEPEMKAMLKEGRDPYVEIAREFYGDPTIKKTREDGSENPKYRTFKSFAHGTHYLGTPYGLAGRLGLTVHQAEKTQRWYLGRMRRIAEWQKEFCAALKSRRYAQNVFGYRRYYFGQVTDATCREAIAWVPQSTVALYINRIWMNIYERFPHIWILLQVHDSLVGQYPRHRREESLRNLEEASQIVLPYDDPLIIPSGTKTSTVSWGAC